MCSVDSFSFLADLLHRGFFFKQSAKLGVDQSAVTKKGLNCLAFDNNSYAMIWHFQSLGKIRKLPFDLNHLRFATRNHLSAEKVTVGRILHPKQLRTTKRK